MSGKAVAIIAVLVVLLLLVAAPILHGLWVLFKIGIFLLALLIVAGAVIKHFAKKWEKEQEG